MDIPFLGLSVTRRKTIVGQTSPTLSPVEALGGWWPLLRESYAGAWQANVTVSLSDVIVNPTVFSCVTLIASDIGKMNLRLVAKDDDGIWTETEAPAFSPVLRKPNRYQTRIKFVEQWLVSKLLNGNTYVLKQRDARGVVVALYILDPNRVRVMVAPDGAVYYNLHADNLAGLTESSLLVPAREIIHDVMYALYHPLVGLSPIYACGMAAYQGVKIQENSTNFFANGSKPGGVLTAPGAIAQATADRLKAYWDANYTGENAGKIAVLGDGLKYEKLSVDAKDAELIGQLKWSDEKVCSCYHVPPYMVGVGPAPTYNNIQALSTQYFTQCLQELVECFELSMDEGLELPKPYGTEFNTADLLRMDSTTMIDYIAKGVGAGVMKPNEGRFLLNYKPVEGGDTPYLQQQNYSLSALNRRDQEPAPSETTPVAPVEDPEANDPEADDPETDDPASGDASSDDDATLDDLEPDDTAQRSSRR
jgi:HK97 family phage portal protein